MSSKFEIVLDKVDDICEKFEMEGLHSHPTYKQFKRLFAELKAATSDPADQCLGEPVALSAEELRFMEVIAMNPGAKLNGGIAWDDEGNALWKRLEELGLIVCVGGYKWRLAFNAVELGVKAFLSQQPAPVAVVTECKTCGGIRVVDDGELTCSSGGIPYEMGPIKCVKDCPDCASPPVPVSVVPEGFMLVERSIWTEEQVESATQCIAMLMNVPGMTDRDLALAAMDAGQCKAPEIALADFPRLDKAKELNA